MKTIGIPTRYYRLYRDDSPFQCDEQDFHYQDEELSLPAGQCALVLVDCWNNHYAGSWLRRGAAIIREVVLPVVEATRQAGIPVIHAPTERVARRYPQSERFFEPGDEESSTRYADPDGEWPREDFVKRTGEYERYRRRFHPSGWKHHTPPLLIADCLGPEPADFVVRSGSQLHRLLKSRRMLHLFYAGFATNMCVLHRDYGMRAMANRGYNLIFIRDATTAVETHDTVDEQVNTEVYTREIETMLAYSTTSRDFIEALAKGRR